MSRAQTLITENIATWTGAIQAKSTAGRGSSNKYELYGIKKLRELILELAVRGKLVPQDPNDEPASVLLERIAAEKAELIKAKKIKKNKALPPISDEEKPFELPDGWEWSRLPNTCHYKVGKTPSTKNSVYWTASEDGIPWVSISDLNHFGAVEQTAKKVTPVAASDVFKAEPVAAGTILMSFKLTLGKISILSVGAYHNEAIISIYPFSGISKQFIFKVLPQRALAGNSKQAIMGNTLNSESLNALLIPVPPFTEQQRIVQKVDELMALCDQLEQQTESSIEAHSTLVDTLLDTLSNSANADELQQNWARIAEHFDTLFTTERSIDALKQTILQLAVMGKLVRQNPHDEPASALLERIAEEKDRLVKEKKIKKQKPLPEISEDEKPFELPEGWEWIRVEHIAQNKKHALKAGPFGSALKKSMYVSEGYKIYGQEQVIADDENIGDYYIAPEKYDELSSCSIVPQDILISLVGTIGKVLVLSENCLPGIINPRLVKISLYHDIDRGYMKLVFSSNLVKNELKRLSHGGTMDILNLGIIKKLVFPIPPIDEQHHIVAKVDELMTLCDQLKDKLRQSQQTQVHLTDAIIEQVLA